MDRRTLLGSVSAAGVVALTGCLAGGGGEDTPSDNRTATETPTPTPAPEPTLIGSGFEVGSVQSGTRADSAMVSTESLDVVIDGVIWGADGCRTAELASVTLNDGELTVAVETTEREDAGDACTTGIVEIAYTATVEFSDGLPETVVVTHDRGDGPETVVTTSP